MNLINYTILNLRFFLSYPYLILLHFMLKIRQFVEKIVPEIQNKGQHKLVHYFNKTCLKTKNFCAVFYFFINDAIAPS